MNDDNIDDLCEAIFEEIKHGDDEHKSWLAQKLQGAMCSSLTHLELNISGTSDSNAKEIIAESYFNTFKFDKKWGDLTHSDQEYWRVYSSNSIQALEDAGYTISKQDVE